MSEYWLGETQIFFFFFLHLASKFWACKWKYRFRWIQSNSVFLWLYVPAEIDWSVTVWLFSQVYYMLGLIMADVGQGLCTMELKATAISWLVDWQNVQLYWQYIFLCPFHRAGQYIDNISLSWHEAIYWLRFWLYYTWWWYGISVVFSCF